MGVQALGHAYAVLRAGDSGEQTGGGSADFLGAVVEGRLEEVLVLLGQSVGEQAQEVGAGGGGLGRPDLGQGFARGLGILRAESAQPGPALQSVAVGPQLPVVAFSNCSVEEAPFRVEVREPPGAAAGRGDDERTVLGPVAGVVGQGRQVFGRHAPAASISSPQPLAERRRLEATEHRGQPADRDRPGQRPILTRGRGQRFDLTERRATGALVDSRERGGIQQTAITQAFLDMLRQFLEVRRPPVRPKQRRTRPARPSPSQDHRPIVVPAGHRAGSRRGSTHPRP